MLFFCQFPLLSHLSNVHLGGVFQGFGIGGPSCAGKPTSPGGFLAISLLWGRCRLFLRPALYVYCGDDESTQLLWMTGHAGFASASGAEESSTFISDSPRDAAWDRQEEPLNCVESREVKCRVCRALCFHANWEWA